MKSRWMTRAGFSMATAMAASVRDASPGRPPTIMSPSCAWRASRDAAEPVAPRPPCLSGTRDSAASHLTWKAPDNGGSDVVNYQILRGTAPGNEVFLGQTGNAGTTYNDATADPSVSHYYYVVKAVSALGAGSPSNEADLVVVNPPPPENVCELPGLTKLNDPSGDTSAALGIVTTPAPPGSDLHSFRLSQPYATDG